MLHHATTSRQYTVTAMSSLPTNVLSALSAHGAAALPLDASLTGAPALQQAQEARSCWSEELLRSLVDRYTLRLAREEEIQRLNSEWMEKQREWDLTANVLQVRVAVTLRNQL